MSVPPPRADLRVRAAVIADADAIGEAHARAWAHAYVDLLPPEALERAVAQRLGTGHALTSRLTEHGPGLEDGTVLLVATVAGRVVGFAHAGPSTGGEGELFALYVHPDHWGSGAAYALFHSPALRPAPRVLWTLAGAARARAFYERQGWRPTGERHDHDFGLFHDLAVVEYRPAPGP